MIEIAKLNRAQSVAASYPGVVWLSLHLLTGWLPLLFAVVVLGAPWQEAAKAALWWLTLIGVLRWLAFAGAAVVWRLVFVITQAALAIDLATVLMLHGFFGVMPQPTVVVEAIVNTNAAEVGSFITAQKGPIARSVVAVLLVGLMGWGCLPGLNACRAEKSERRFVLGLLFYVGAVFTVLLHFNPTMQRSHPFLRPVVVLQRYDAALAQVQAIGEQRHKVQQQIANWQPRLEITRAQTVIVVVGESSNRSNWGLYGYERDTTAPLSVAFEAVGGELLLQTATYSTEAFTLPSLRESFIATGKGGNRSKRSKSVGDLPDIFQLAQAASYELSWLSNQPKGEGWFAAIANAAEQQVFVNAGNWRDSSTSDLALLEPLSQAVATSKAAHQLIVLHTLGQHFFYGQRCAGMASVFDMQEDIVTLAMRQAGRQESIVEARNAYDSAVHCGAEFLAKVVTLANKLPSDRDVKVVYFSDHGQEVGHNADVASHSAIYESGYTVPLWVWSREPLPLSWRSHMSGYFELGGLPHMLHSVLGVNSTLYDATSDVLSPIYQQPQDTVVERKSLK